MARYRNGENVKPFLANLFFNIARNFYGTIISAILVDGKGITNMHVYRE